MLEPAPDRAPVPTDLGPEGAPLADLRVVLVGPGRVGTSLGSWLLAAGARVVGVMGRDGRRTTALARAWGARAVIDSGGEPPPAEAADLLLLTVSDAALAPLAARLAGRLQARIALHTAGALGASVLAPLREAGTAVGSFHPLMAFPATVERAPAGLLFAIDGDAPARALATRLAGTWGGTAVEVPEGSRRLYHAAATLAAGGVTTLLAAACRLAENARLPAAIGRAYSRLALGALERARLAEHPGDAITGPVARGDEPATLAALAAISSADAELGELARRLALETLRQLRDRGLANEHHQSLTRSLSQRITP